MRDRTHSYARQYTCVSVDVCVSAWRGLDGGKKQREVVCVFVYKSVCVREPERENKRENERGRARERERDLYHGAFQVAMSHI